MVLTTDEYDAAYFGDQDQPLRHVAGYTDYAFLRNQPRTLQDPNTKVFTQTTQKEERFKTWLLKADITGKVLELGCGYGWNRKLGLSIPGITDWDLVDVSAFAKTKADIDDQAFFTVADARDFLQTLPNRSYDHIVSFRFLECFIDEDVQLMVDEISRITTGVSIHTFSGGLRTPESYFPNYNTKLLADWQSSIKFKNKTMLIASEDYTVFLEV